MNMSDLRKPTKRVKERRVAAKPRATISQIIERMEAEADLNHLGNLSDNALKIFSGLPVDDKRTFLRNSITLLWEKRIDLSIHGHEDVFIDKDTRIDAMAVERERLALEKMEYTEQMRLKSVIVTTFFFVSLAVFGLVTYVAFTHGGVETAGAENSLKNLGKILEVLLTFK